jgi:hypothetical protein
MKVYIKGKGIIAPNKITDEIATDAVAEKMYCLEPDYTQYFDNKMLRRMSRIVKLSSAAALMALKDANVEIPAAVVVGTGFGCLEDTSLFLRKMITNKEETLNPTPFIFSTHNTIAAQIAIQLKTHGYNSTYAHRNFSFESALLDAFLLLKENEINNVLVGGADELTEDSFPIFKRLNYFKNNIAGEGASFFVLTNESDQNCLAELKSVHFFSNTTVDEVKTKLNFILKGTEIDVILIGSEHNNLHENDIAIINTLQLENKVIYYKHLSGEYPTANAFALGLAVDYFKNNAIKNLLIYNHYADSNHSFIILERC